LTSSVIMGPFAIVPPYIRIYYKADIIPTYRLS
jgi:hypothetical protein